MDWEVRGGWSTTVASWALPNLEPCLLCREEMWEADFAYSTLRLLID